MSRHYAKISKDLFLEHVRKMMEEDYQFMHQPRNSQILKDLSKIFFDTENVTDFTDTKSYATYPIGYRDLGNDLHVFFVNAGGDWEFPICFVLYWSGSALRAYIPEDGNVFHKPTKAAYGSIQDSDLYDPDRDGDDPEFDSSELEKLIDHDKLFADITKRIKLK